MIIGLDIESDWTEDHKRTWIVQGAISTPHGVHGTVYDADTPSEIWDMVDAMRSKHRNITMCAHNLKFDFSFIDSELYKRTREEGTDVSVLARAKSPIEVRVVYPNKTTLRIQDTLRKYPSTSLSAVGEMLGIPKLESPTKWFAGWSKEIDINSKENRQYVRRDAEICRLALEYAHSRGLKKLTMGSDAWKDLTDMYGPVFRKDYPKLSRQQDLLLRAAASGGINHTLPGYHKNIRHYDLKASYSAVCVFDKLPIGEPKYVKFDELKEGDCFILQSVYMKMELKEGHIPWFCFRSFVEANMEGLSCENPVVKTKFWHELTLTSVDLEQLEEDYHLKYEFHEGTKFVKFSSRIGKLVPYYNKWFGIREQSKAKKTVKERGDNQLAKFFCNGLTGKFGQGTMFDQSDLTENGICKIGTIFEEFSNGYVPMYAFITAYGRRNLLRGARMFSPREVIHMDTDSVITTGEMPREMLGSNLGEWELEAEYDAIYERGYKRYIEMDGEIPHITCAGVRRCNDRDGWTGAAIELADNPAIFLNKNLIIGRENYHVESSWLKERIGEYADTRRLVSRRVEGGTVLVPESIDMSEKLFKPRFAFSDNELEVIEDSINDRITVL